MVPGYPQVLPGSGPVADIVVEMDAGSVPAAMGVSSRPDRRLSVRGHNDSWCEDEKVFVNGVCERGEERAMRDSLLSVIERA